MGKATKKYHGLCWYFSGSIIFSLTSVVRNPFHPSPSDPIQHAIGSHEKGNGSLVNDKPRHVAEKPDEQSQVCITYLEDNVVGHPSSAM